jgi:hypothetical protein
LREALKAMQVVHERSSSLCSRYVMRVYTWPGSTHETERYPGVYQKRVQERVLAGVRVPPSLGTKPLTLTLSRRERG